MTRTTHTLAALIAALTGTLALTGPVSAQEAERGQRAMERFAALDTDGDGKITAEELRTARAARIAGLDADADGYLTAEELVAHETRRAAERTAERVERMMATHDLDGDGRLGAAELFGGNEGRIAEWLFDRADADSDGAVTEEEFRTAMFEMQGDHRQGGRERGWRRGGHGPARN